MIKRFSYAPILFSFFCISCSDLVESLAGKEEENEIILNEEIPNSFVGSGSLVVGDNVDNYDPSLTANRELQLSNNQDQIIATSMTNEHGEFEFTIESENILRSGGLSFGAMQLTSSFIDDQENDDPVAYGINQELIISSKSFSLIASNSKTFHLNNENTESIDFGEFPVNKIGAIAGQVTLASGLDPTGIYIYIPGTSFNATTDSDGFFLLSFLSQGSYSVRADYDNHLSILWEDIQVDKEETTNLDPAIMQISEGSTITNFTIDTSDPEVATLRNNEYYALNPYVSFSFSTEGADRYKICSQKDCSHIAYEVIDTQAEQITGYVTLIGNDGEKTITLFVSDPDGNEVSRSLTINLDTEIPATPNITISSHNSIAGYTNTTNPNIFVNDCDGIDKILIVLNENSSVPNNEEDFSNDFAISCAKASLKGGTELILPSNLEEKNHNLSLWTLDQAGRIAQKSISYSLTFDSILPSISESPSANQEGSVLANSAIEVNICANEDANVFYTLNLADPDDSSPSIEINSSNSCAQLVLIDNATLKYKVIDLAGNESEVQTRNYIIDNDGPILASINTFNNARIVNSATIPLVLEAEGADKMKISESLSTLRSSTLLNFSENYDFTLSDDSDGQKIIYVMFADSAGNTIGEHGDYFTTFELVKALPE